MFLWVCPPRCWSGVPTCAAMKNRWWRRTPTSASPRRCSSRRFRSPDEFGATSTAISSFLNGPATFWAVGGQVAQPIFQGGRIRSNYRLAWALRDDAELTYKKTVLTAFGDVSNSLVGYTDSRKFRMKIQEQTDTYRETARLATVRYQGGVTSFLEVLVTEQDYFTSELQLSQAWFLEMQNYVQLYQALGGGWDPQRP